MSVAKIAELERQVTELKAALRRRNQGRFWTARQVADELGVSSTYICAIKKVRGITARWLDLEDFRMWILEHPDFRVHHAWPKRDSRQRRRIHAPETFPDHQR